MPGTAIRFEGTDKVTRFPNGEERVVELLGVAVGLATFEPGWRWTSDVRPLVGGERCSRLHAGYMVSGRLHVEFEDGSTMDVRSGDVVDIPPDHDAWVVGDEPVVLLDWAAALKPHAKVE